MTNGIEFNLYPAGSKVKLVRKLKVQSRVLLPLLLKSTLSPNLAPVAREGKNNSGPTTKADDNRAADFRNVL